MTELRNVEADISRFRTRILFAGVAIFIAFGLLISRLVFLQILRHDTLDEQAENNRTAIVPVVPDRGLIYDRNGIALTMNYSAYTLEVAAFKTENVDKTIEELSTIIDIQPKDKRRFKRLMEENGSFASLPLRSRLTDDEVARFSARRYRFPGVDVKARQFRNYPYGDLASHAIGYVGRINSSDKERLEESDKDANYRGTDYIGKQGIEQSYEEQLHGFTGVEEMEKSAGGRATRQLGSRPASPGDTIYLSLDLRMQKLVEDMFGKRRGALVAIDPRNGEILAFVSKPSFDPNLFVDGIDTDSWAQLNESLDKPMLNRALRGTYPPGSTYKPFMALAALQTGKRSAGRVINDTGSWTFHGNEFRGHAVGPVDMRGSIIHSSNMYYYTLANDMGVDLIHDFMKPLGFGQLTGIDLSGEARGILPSMEWKRKTYSKQPRQQKWFPGETISLGIGQGYNNFTMLQLATATATLANNGIQFKPHLVMDKQDVNTHQRVPIAQEPPKDLGYAADNVALVRRAMVGVTQLGTSKQVFAGAGYLSGGKTGTAQAVGVAQNKKYNAGALAEYQRDHSLYIAYAPAEAPTIALAVIVENAGFGAEHAAPMARRVFDYWLLKRYPSEADIHGVQKGHAVNPIGAYRDIAQVPLVPQNATAPPRNTPQPSDSASGAKPAEAASVPVPVPVAQEKATTPINTAPNNTLPIVPAATPAPVATTSIVTPAASKTQAP